MMKICTLFPLALCLLFASCASNKNEIVVSVKDQKLAVVEDGKVAAIYPVSTSQFGVGDRHRSFKTPIGSFEVAQRIGGGQPEGAVFKSRQATGEVLRPNAPGRDPIVTRILWLRGTERATKNAYDRCIYIHGTPEEKNIGKPCSWGCVRMRSEDIVELYDQVEKGQAVRITTDDLDGAVRG